MTKHSGTGDGPRQGQSRRPRPWHPGMTDRGDETITDYIRAKEREDAARNKPPGKNS